MVWFVRECGMCIVGYYWGSGGIIILVLFVVMVFVVVYECLSIVLFDWMWGYVVV